MNRCVLPRHAAAVIQAIRELRRRRAIHLTPKWLAAFLTLILFLPAHAASSWRFWTKADGLTESVVFGLTAGNSGRVFIKSGDVPTITTLDGYRITQIPNLHAYGRLLSSPENE